MIQGANLKLQFTEYNKVDGKTLYYIQVTDQEQTWTISARYSFLEEIHKQLKELNKKMPEFPKKKMFGNDDPKFISKRQKELEHYMCLLIDNPTKYQLKPLYDFLMSGKKKVPTRPENPVNSTVSVRPQKEGNVDIEKENYDKFSAKLVQIPKKNENFLLEEANDGNKAGREQVTSKHVFEKKKQFKVAMSQPTDISDIADGLMNQILNKYGNLLNEVIKQRVMVLSSEEEFVQKIVPSDQSS